LFSSQIFQQADLWTVGLLVCADTFKECIK